ncbi:hypothetical protein ABS200_16780 [Acinetobacter baumannii]
MGGFSKTEINGANIDQKIQELQQKRQKLADKHPDIA